MADIVFDFDYYTKVINYINDSTQITDENLNDIINNIMEVRKKVSVRIPMYSDLYKEIQIGGVLKITPVTNTWEMIGDSKIELNQNKLIATNIELTDKSVIIKDYIDEYIKYLSNEFISIETDSNDEKYIIANYVDDIYNGDFSGKEIPSFYWFKDKYYTKQDYTIDFVLNSINIDDSNNQVLNSAIGDNLSSVNISKKNINVKITDSIIGDSFKITSNFISVDSNLILEINNVSTSTLSDFNSVLTNKAINNTYIIKDLSNLTSVSVLENEDELSLVNNESAVKYLNEKNCTYYFYFKINKDTVCNINTIIDKKVDFSKLIELIYNKDSLKEVLEDIIGNVSLELTNKDISLLLLYYVSGYIFDEDIKNLVEFEKVKAVKLNGVPAHLSSIHFVVLLLNNIYGELFWTNHEFYNLTINKGFIYNKDDYKIFSNTIFNNSENVVNNFTLLRSQKHINNLDNFSYIV